jgi:hypothetical protein
VAALLAATSTKISGAPSILLNVAKRTGEKAENKLFDANSRSANP